jgi:hypothetical protein
LRVDAQVEVGDDPVPQILGGEIVQRCPGHGSNDRSDIVSLIIDYLHELRQRWPVALSEESLVELAGQGRPHCSGPIRGRFGQPSLETDDVIATTNLAVATAAQLDPSDVTRSIESGHEAHRGHSFDARRVARTQDPGRGGHCSAAISNASTSSRPARSAAATWRAEPARRGLINI